MIHYLLLLLIKKEKSKKLFLEKFLSFEDFKLFATVEKREWTEI